MSKEASTNEIMEFMRDNVATKDDVAQGLNKQKQEIFDTFDDKLSDLKSDLVVLMRKEDKKVVELINLLKTKSVLSSEEADKILALQPFPQ
tara:strand:+ start:797 stop:1069 length:273 start_codon:yes stop_codon:yes gene_type:complete